MEIHPSPSASTSARPWTVIVRKHTPVMNASYPASCANAVHPPPPSVASSSSSTSPLAFAWSAASYRVNDSGNAIQSRTLSPDRRNGAHAPAASARAFLVLVLVLALVSFFFPPPTAFAFPLPFSFPFPFFVLMSITVVACALLLFPEDNIFGTDARVRRSYSGPNPVSTLAPLSPATAAITGANPAAMSFVSYSAPASALASDALNPRYVPSRPPGSAARNLSIVNTTSNIALWPTAGAPLLANVRSASVNPSDSASSRFFAAS
jgi:hypothetical protein